MARRFRPLKGQLSLRSPFIRAAFGPLIAACLLCVASPAPAASSPSPSPTPTPPGAAPKATPAPQPKSSPTPPGKPPTPAPAKAPQPPSKPPQPNPTFPPAQPGKGDTADVQRWFNQLSPGDQKKFVDNLLQWRSMSPEEQELLRDRDLIRREKIAEEIQDAIAKSGLYLDEDQKEVYQLRYTQERRKIEDAIRKQTDAMRATMLNEMLARLKAEFANAPTPAPIPVPTPGH